MSQENVDLVRRAWDAWGRRDMHALFAFYDPAIIWDPTHSGISGLSDTYEGHGGVREFFRKWVEPFDGYYAHAEEFIDAGDDVVVRVRQGGRGRQSGAQVEMPSYWQVYRLRHGKAVRVEIYRTERDALSAVGLPE